MMKLRSFSVDQELQTELDVYLTKQLSFETLKNICLAQKPLDAIVASISLKLDTLTSKDKDMEKASLIKAAHQKQIIQDKQEAQADDELSAQLNDEKPKVRQTLTQVETSLEISRNQLNTYETNLLCLKIKLDRFQTQINELNSQLKASNAPAVHHHPASQHVHHHLTPPTQLLESLRLQLQVQLHNQQLLLEEKITCNCQIAQLNSTLATLSDQKYNINNHLANIERQQEAIKTRKIARNERSDIRKTTSKYLENTLTYDNRNSLRSEIKKATQALDDHCQELKQATSTRCYGAFLNQLENSLDAMKLTNNEKKALALIITLMREHLCDLANLEQETTKQKQLEASLTTSQDKLVQNKELTSWLNNHNVKLNEKNTALTPRITELSSQKTQLVNNGNQYAKYSLISALLGGVSAATVFVLIQASILTVTPLLMILGVGIIVTPLVCLLTMASIAGIRALIQQSQINSILENINNNTTQITANNTRIEQEEAKTLPLENQILAKRTELNKQQDVTQDAQTKANQSLSKARNVTPETPSSVQSHAAFFQPKENPPAYSTLPSAPPLEIINGIQ